MKMPARLHFTTGAGVVLPLEGYQDAMNVSRWSTLRADNYLAIMPGWNYTARLYQPRAEVLKGTWKLPEPKVLPESR